MKAYLNNYRQSPRKVRLVANLVKGKSVARALAELQFLPKRAALPIEKLLASAVANAKNTGSDEKNLIVLNVTVDKGLTLKRMMPRARGSASRINKRSSHIMLTLAEKDAKPATAPKKEKATVTVKAKAPAKKKVTTKQPTSAKGGSASGGK